jgi:hypothetical protein
MVGSDTDPFGFGEGTKVILKQTHKAMNGYFDFLKESFFAVFLKRNGDWGQVEGREPVYGCQIHK